MVPIPVYDPKPLWRNYCKSPLLWAEHHKNSALLRRVQGEFVETFNYTCYDNAKRMPIDRQDTTTIYKLSYQAVTGLKLENDPFIRYAVGTYGPQPATGYPLYISLHGGGGSYEPKERAEYEEANNGSWKSMYTNYYISQLSEAFDNGGKKDGPSSVHVAIRGLSIPGVTDTWDLLFRSEFCILLERLLRNLMYPDPVEAKGATPVSPTFVNPNRVYLMGFSAGGDGVYHLSTTMSDRFTAANMSAGHPGGVKLENLANVPLCLQVGSGDGRDLNPHRDTEAARCSLDLNNLVEGAKAFDSSKKYYEHDCFIHLNINGAPHNGWGRPDELTNNPALIVSQDSLGGTGGWWASNEKTLSANNNFKTASVVTNTVGWVTYQNPLAPSSERQIRIRDPIPAYVVWDLAGRPDQPDQKVLPAGWTPKNFSYWLMIPPNYGGKGLIRALYNKSTPKAFIPENSVWIQTLDKEKNVELDIPVTILLNKDMLDLNKPIKVYGGNAPKLLKEITQIVEDGMIQTKTLAARGDPNFIFSARITVTGKNVETGPWEQTSSTAKARL